MDALLRLAGVLCMIVGVGVELVGFATKHPAARTAHAQEGTSPVSTSAPTAATATVGPYAPALSTALYAQNRFYHATAALTGQTTLRYTIDTRFTERLTIGFDRPVAACLVSQGDGGRALHVFRIAGVPGYAAVAFFSTAQRLASAGASISCTLAQPVSSARTDGDAFVPIDAIVAHHRLEYAAHANLAGLPQALYPARDPALQRVPVPGGDAR